MDHVTEIARITAKPGSADEMSTGLTAAVAVVAQAPGCHQVTVHRCIEDRDDFVLVAVWTEVADHERFRESDLFPQYRAHFQDFLEGLPQFAHYEELAAVVN